MDYRSRDRNPPCYHDVSSLRPAVHWALALAFPFWGRMRNLRFATLVASIIRRWDLLLPVFSVKILTALRSSHTYAVLLKLSQVQMFGCIRRSNRRSPRAPDLRPGVDHALLPWAMTSHS